MKERQNSFPSDRPAGSLAQPHGTSSQPVTPQGEWTGEVPQVVIHSSLGPDIFPFPAASNHPVTPASPATSCPCGLGHTVQSGRTSIREPVS